MKKEEFVNWYNEKLAEKKHGYNWFYNKARWLLSTTGISYSEIEELIQATIYSLLEQVDKLEISGIDGYCYITMRNIMFNQFLYHKNKVCCTGENFPEMEYKEYNPEDDEKYNLIVEKVFNVAETPVEKSILEQFLSGKSRQKLVKEGNDKKLVYDVIHKAGLKNPLPVRKRVPHKRKLNPKKNGRKHLNHPQELKNLLNLSDKILFSDYYILKRSGKEVRQAHNLSDKEFKAFLTRVQRKRKVYENSNQINNR